jgi:hypothetical protein
LRKTSLYIPIVDASKALAEVGIKNSDFAFSDKIIFVEGQTELNEFPKILEKFGILRIGYNYNILELRGTGDEFRKEKVMMSNSKVFESIFKCLSSQVVPYMFLIDRDERTYDTLKKYYKSDCLALLDVREFENYLLNAAAIAHLLKSEYSKDVEISEIRVFIDKCLEKNDEKALFPKGLLTNEPIKDIKGSKVLDLITKEYVSENYTYSKVKDGAILVDWILDNQPDELKSVFDILEKFLVIK